MILQLRAITSTAGQSKPTAISPEKPETYRTQLSDIRLKNNACMFPDIRIIQDPIFEEDHAKIARENFKKTREFKDKISKAKDDIRCYLSTLKVEKDI